MYSLSPDIDIIVKEGEHSDELRHLQANIKFLEFYYTESTRRKICFSKEVTVNPVINIVQTSSQGFGVGNMYRDIWPPLGSKIYERMASVRTKIEVHIYSFRTHPGGDQQETSPAARYGMYTESSEASFWHWDHKQPPTQPLTSRTTTTAEWQTLYQQSVDKNISLISQIKIYLHPRIKQERGLQWSGCWTDGRNGTLSHALFLRIDATLYLWAPPDSLLCGVSSIPCWELESGTYVRSNVCAALGWEKYSNHLPKAHSAAINLYHRYPVFMALFGFTLA